MYMLAFVTLMIAITGIYAQVMAVQTARFYASQTTFAEAMLAWHATAVAEVLHAGITNNTTLAGCNLTKSGHVAASRCKNAVNIITVDGGGGALPICNENLLNAGTKCFTSLPNGYNAAYIFNSIAYTSGTQQYVVTYVPPPTVTAANPAPGFIMLPQSAAGATQIGISMSDLWTQMGRMGISAISYGTVQGGSLVSTTMNPGGVITYQLPTVNGAVPASSIALISTP